MCNRLGSQDTWRWLFGTTCAIHTAATATTATIDAESRCRCVEFPSFNALILFVSNVCGSRLHSLGSFFLPSTSPRATTIRSEIIDRMHINPQPWHVFLFSFFFIRATFASHPLATSCALNNVCLSKSLQRCCCLRVLCSGASSLLYVLQTPFFSLLWRECARSK
uniref:Secreted protein n=1 Tax=Trichogramma kaykai TaxID=54128 RepID=A0ABD2X825_9HYME